MPKHTQCVHSGARKDKATRGLNTPIYPSSAYEYMDAPENIYPRYFNTPNERRWSKNSAPWRPPRTGCCSARGWPPSAR